MKRFLLKRGWQEHPPTQLYSVFVPDTGLEIESDYKLYVPKIPDTLGFESVLLKSIDTVADIYALDTSDLQTIVMEGKEILNVRIFDENIPHAKPPIRKMKTILGHIEDLLRNTTNFRIQEEQHLTEKNTEEADRYLNLCNFSKNREGSLITSIEVPGDQEIRAANPFKPLVVGIEINQRLMDTFGFITSQMIIPDYVPPTPEFLKSHQNVVSIDVNESVKNLLKSTDVCDVEIQLVGIENEATTRTENISLERIEQIDDFNRVVRESLKEILVINVQGKVFDLHSLDISSNKNRVKMKADVKGVRSDITFYCQSHDYVAFTQAHKENREIQLIGAVLDRTKPKEYKVQKFTSYKLL
jgi:hypothetical protein